MKSRINDGLYTKKIVEQPHDGRTYVETTQNNENAILEENAEWRKQEQTKLQFGRQVARIPQLAYNNLLKQYPELRTGDRHQRNKALMKILAEHPEWRVVPDGKIWAKR